MISGASARRHGVSALLHAVEELPSEVVTTTAAIDVAELDRYRTELTAYCYRMLGSGAEAEDAVQETMLRAWKRAETFEGRSSPKSWLYGIATNVCLDMHRSPQRRARPMDLGPSSPPVESYLAPPLPETTWISPIGDDRILPRNADPSEVAELRESVRLAFVAALQHLPAKQRAVLILCEVLRWQASEVAELLESSVASVNSALQRARAGLAALPSRDVTTLSDADDPELLERYVSAFERYDIAELVTLLHDDAIQSMPPFAMWLEGAENIGRWMVEPAPSACRGSRLVQIRANGCPGFAQYRPSPGGGHHAWALVVLEVIEGKVREITAFLDVEELFPAFGLPLALPAA
jgi:RNA polymerase sigma-70 factor (ECF subfamily)